MVPRLLVWSILHAVTVYADVVFEKPLAGDNAPLDLAISWKDADRAPSIEDLQTYTLDLLVGGNEPSNQAVVQTIVHESVFVGNKVATELLSDLAANVKDGFFLRINSTAKDGGYVINYSDRFSIPDMKGSTPRRCTKAVAALQGDTAGPLRVLESGHGTEQSDGDHSSSQTTQSQDSDHATSTTPVASSPVGTATHAEESSSSEGPTHTDDSSHAEESSSSDGTTHTDDSSHSEQTTSSEAAVNDDDSPGHVNTSDEESKLSDGAEAGIAVGICGGILLIIGGAIGWRITTGRKKRVSVLGPTSIGVSAGWIIFRGNRREKLDDVETPREVKRAFGASVFNAGTEEEELLHRPYSHHRDDSRPVSERTEFLGSPPPAARRFEQSVRHHQSSPSTEVLLGPPSTGQQRFEEDTGYYGRERDETWI